MNEERPEAQAPFVMACKAEAELLYVACRVYLYIHKEVTSRVSLDPALYDITFASVYMFYDLCFASW